MATPKFTPGEWEAVGLGSEGYDVRPVALKGLCGEEWRDRRQELGLTTICAVRGGDWETLKANAHMIATCPDMYEALRFVVDRENLMFAECSDAEEILSVCKAAIAKAEGAQR